MKFPRVHLAIVIIAFLVSQSFFGQTVLENEEWYVKKPRTIKKVANQDVGLSTFKVVANKEKSSKVSEKRLAFNKKKKKKRAKKESSLTIGELENMVDKQRLRYRKVTNRCFKTIESRECGAK